MPAAPASTANERKVGGLRNASPVVPFSLRNSEVADSFDEMAELLAIEGDNAFRVRAYQRAAQVIRTLPQPLAEWRTLHEFDELPGVGADLAKKIAELLATGRMRALEQVRQRVPAGLRALLQLPGLGPVRVRALYAGLGVSDVDGLRRAIQADRLVKVRGFGPALRERLRVAVAAIPSSPRHMRNTTDAR